MDLLHEGYEQTQALILSSRVLHMNERRDRDVLLQYAIMLLAISREDDVKLICDVVREQSSYAP